MVRVETDELTNYSSSEWTLLFTMQMDSRNFLSWRLAQRVVGAFFK